ncbi:MAG: hypothetical protein R3F60_14200 [bacterium]
MTRAISLLVALALGLGALTGCDDAEEAAGPRWIDDVEAPLPEWLSETGLYGRMTTFQPGSGVRPYQPPHPLWSSGTQKDRLLFLPAGATIDTAASWAWEFPVGTVLAKTFAYSDIEGRQGAVAMETRLLFRRAGGWGYAQYHWNVQGTEARLREADWPEEALELHYAGDLAFGYTLPGEIDCKSCHEAREGPPVLGISNRNLPEELGDLLTGPAAALPAEGRTPEETAAMKYLLGNCVHCHHGGEGNDNATYSLLPSDLVANTVGQPTESSASGDGIRVVPGDADGSALFEAVVRTREPGYRGQFKPMPPLGIDQVDPEAARTLRAWIESL